RRRARGGCPRRTRRLILGRRRRRRSCWTFVLSLGEDCPTPSPRPPRLCVSVLQTCFNCMLQGRMKACTGKEALLFLYIYLVLPLITSARESRRIGQQSKDHISLRGVNCSRTASMRISRRGLACREPEKR